MTVAADQGPSFWGIESALMVLSLIVPFCGARFGSFLFVPAERCFNRLANHRGLAVLVVGLTELFTRLAILPILPVPRPFVPDDFSFLLAADTFAHGRLANPTPALWQHFESIQIDMLPTYGSMYFPAEGLVLAAGKVLFGSEWAGQLIVSALMCAALCWMLQVWLPPTWALLGGFIAVMRLGLFSYWINTYTGAGMIGALGGALVLGAFPRLIRDVRLRDGLLLATGIVILALTRPYEGFLLCLPVLAVLLNWIVRGQKSGSPPPSPALLLRRAALPVALVIAAGAWMAYYDSRAFGSATTLPYTVNRQTYAMAPYYVWQKVRPEPHYRFAEIREFYYREEVSGARKFETGLGAALACLIKVEGAILFFSAFLLIPPLIMARRVIKDRRTRFLLICLLLFMAGMSIEIFMIPHYLAPFTAVFYGLGLQATRHLRAWKLRGQRFGIGMVRLLVVSCVVMCWVRIAEQPLHIRVPQLPVGMWAGNWFGPDPEFGKPRADMEARLEQMPGKQLVIVRYATNHDPMSEWVYNSADIDNSKVVWARDMDSANNKELIEHCKDRSVWLVRPDEDPYKIESYTSK